MTRGVLFTVFLIGAAVSAFAGENKVSRLIPTGENLQIYDEPVAGGGAEPIERVKRLAPQLPKPVRSLGHAPTYDLREQVRSSGVEFDADDMLLYAADTRLIYVRASKENVEIVDALFKMLIPRPIAYEVALTVLSESDKGEKDGKRLAFFHVATVNGADSEVAVAERGKPDGEKKVTFSMVVGPDPHVADFELSGKLPLFDEDVTLSIKTIAEVNKNVTIYEQSNGTEGHSALKLQLLITPKYTREQLEQTEEWQAKKIKEIEAELAR